MHRAGRWAGRWAVGGRSVGRRYALHRACLAPLVFLIGQLITAQICINYFSHAVHMLAHALCDTAVSDISRIAGGI